MCEDNILRESGTGGCLSYFPATGEVTGRAQVCQAGNCSGGGMIWVLPGRWPETMRALGRTLRRRKSHRSQSHNVHKTKEQSCQWFHWEPCLKRPSHYAGTSQDTSRSPYSGCKRIEDNVSIHARYIGWHVQDRASRLGIPSRKHAHDRRYGFGNFRSRNLMD